MNKNLNFDLPHTAIKDNWNNTMSPKGLKKKKREMCFMI